MSVTDFSSFSRSKSLENRHRTLIVTDDTSQLPMSWLKSLASLNISFMVFTCVEIKYSTRLQCARIRPPEPLVDFHTGLYGRGVPAADGLVEFGGAMIGVQVFAKKKFHGRDGPGRGRRVLVRPPRRAQGRHSQNVETAERGSTGRAARKRHSNHRAATDEVSQSPMYLLKSKAL